MPLVTAARGDCTPAWLPIVFCVSGFSALVYQVVWQRVLFTAFGVNVESVTVVVTAFLAGLGLGSLAGGSLAARSRDLLLVFGVTECLIGAFGIISIAFFHWVGSLTLQLPDVARGAVTALIVMIATMPMGATLPLLVAYSVPRNGNVGRTVGRLYFVNTAGSALAAFATVLVLLGGLGERRTVAVAVAGNLIAGLFVLSRRAGDADPK
jgi:spermidine synthase